MPVDGWGRNRTFRTCGDRIAHISPRRSSENYISPSGKYPPGKLHFSFTPSPTDTRNTSADFW